MARRPDRRVLAALDAQSAGFLARERERGRLPIWLGLYRHVKPGGGETITILTRRDAAALRGAEPRVLGKLPLHAAIIRADLPVDPSARYLLRLWMAYERKRKHGGDLSAWYDLLAHPPSTDKRAANLLAKKVERDAALEKTKASARAEAARLRNPDASLSNTAIALHVKERLKLKQAVRTIRGWFGD